MGKIRMLGWGASARRYYSLWQYERDSDSKRGPTMDNVVSLPTLFQQRLFQVPDYQRGYSWERQQVGEFLDDLELIGPGRLHYTGTVVLHEPESDTGSIMDEEGNAYKRVNVVDGQQRLTTIVILLDGIRRCLEDLSDTARNLVNNLASRI